jgi:hypothetical protein
MLLRLSADKLDGRTCGTNGVDGKFRLNFGGKSDGKRLFGRPRYGWQDQQCTDVPKS